MKHYAGNQRIEPGLYMHARNFNIESYSKAGSLPGDGSDRYGIHG